MQPEALKPAKTSSEIEKLTGKKKKQEIRERKGENSSVSHRTSASIGKITET